MTFNHKLIHGNKDVVEILEEAAGLAREGVIQGVIIVGVTPNGSGWRGAVCDEVEWPWARLMAAVNTVQMELCRDGIVEWE